MVLKDFPNKIGDKIFYGCALEEGEIEPGLRLEPLHLENGWIIGVKWEVYPQVKGLASTQVLFRAAIIVMLTLILMCKT